MKKHYKNRALALGLCLSMIASSQTFILANENESITIYHTNDMLGSIDNLPSVKTLKDNTPNSLLVDAGNSLQGTALATYTKGKAIVDIMNSTGYDIMVLGNHEFDFGAANLLENLKQAKFVPLSANTYNKDGSLFLKDINGNGANIIKEVNGRKIGIFGLTTEETYYKTNPKNITDLEFRNIINTAKEQVEYLKSQNVDAIITISHLGDDPQSHTTSIDLAKEVPDIDIIIDGHTNSIIQQKVGDTIIAKTGSELSNLGKLTLNFNGDNLTVSSELLNINEVVKNNTPNKQVEELISKYKNELDSILSEEIAKNKTPIYAYTQDLSLFCRNEETPLGDLIADALLEETKELLKNSDYENLPIVSIYNSGGIRANLDKESITLKDIYSVLPFGNIMSSKLITPNVLYTVLENGVCKLTLDENNEPVGLDGRFPQISGMRVEVDLSKPAYNPDSPLSESGERIQAIYLVNKNGEEMLLDREDNKTQIVLSSNDFVLSGGDGYTSLIASKTVAESGVLNKILENYIIKHSKDNVFDYTPTPANRIEIISEPEISVKSTTTSKYKPISLDTFSYLTEDKEVTLYDDVPEKNPPYWANESIYYFKALGIYKDTKNFYPDKSITYGQFKIIIQKLLGLENSNLEEYGLLSGLNKPYDDSYILKREDVAFIIGNIIKAYNIELPTKSISIKEDVSKFAKNNFQFLVNLGILEGNGKSYEPKKEVTKAELSVILYKLTNLYAK